MDLYKVISGRRSIRKYKSDPVADEKVTKVLEAARIAPSAGNRQPWHFIVITDEEIKGRLKAAYDREWFHTAPVIICACGEPSKSWTRKDGRDYRDVDVAIAFDHLVLAATAEGLGTCWIGAFEPEVVREVLKIPEGIEPVVLTPLGYPDESPAARERKSFADFVYSNTWP
ncbi:MAG: hypothetical protein FD174_2172 [Geobacteraceae bacterium]|nr:MAG: hypothetical protein FD174_2172 [Geobacteraceae bacterium]